MIAKSTKFVKGPEAQKRLISHLKYLEYRTRSERETRDDRRIFSSDEDIVHRRDVVKDIMAHKHHNVTFHKFFLSPSHEEPVTDWRAWIRAVMADLQERQGKQLHWYAVHHENTDDPHTHVVLAGLGENLKTGVPGKVGLYSADYEFLRECGSEHSGYEQQREQKEWMREANERDSQEFKVYDRKEHVSQNTTVSRDRNSRGDFGR